MWSGHETSFIGTRPRPAPGRLGIKPEATEIRTDRGGTGRETMLRRACFYNFRLLQVRRMAVASQVCDSLIPPCLLIQGGESLARPLGWSHWELVLGMNDWESLEGHEKSLIPMTLGWCNYVLPILAGQPTSHWKEVVW